MMPRRRHRAWPASLIGLVLAGSLACAGPSLFGPRRGCPVVPVESSRLSDAANLRARMEMRVAEHRIGLEVVARVQRDELVVVGIAPAGTSLFTVRQRGRELDVTTDSSDRTRSLALWVMDALHRSYWIQPALAHPPATDAADFVWEDERVRESQRGGRRRRAYFRTDGDTSVPGVTIDYPLALAPGPNEPTEIRSEWCGYEAVVAVLDEESRTDGP